MPRGENVAFSLLFLSVVAWMDMHSDIKNRDLERMGYDRPE
jgi:hypothetical protein